MVIKHKAHLIKNYKLGTYGKLTKRTSIDYNNNETNCTGIYLSHLKNTDYSLSHSLLGARRKFDHVSISYML
jgi:hypothetical protein